MFTRMFAVLALGLTFTYSALATPIAPGNTVAPSVLSITGLTAVSPTINSSISPGTFTANYSTGVYADTNNTFCSGCYDFLYVLTNSGPGPIERTTMFDFDGFLANVGYASSGSGSVNPISVDRTSTGGVIGFNFDTNGVRSGQSSSFLIIETNATAYTNGTFSIQDGSAGTGAAYAPVVTPEPSSLLLLATGLLTAGSIARRKAMSV